jgi:hypothetical protein
MKIHGIFKSVWVRKLIGKLGVPYNRCEIESFFTAIAGCKIVGR